MLYKINGESIYIPFEFPVGTLFKYEGKTYKICERITTSNNANWCNCREI